MSKSLLLLRSRFVLMNQLFSWEHCCELFYYFVMMYSASRNSDKEKNRNWDALIWEEAHWWTFSHGAEWIYCEYFTLSSSTLPITTAGKNTFDFYYKFVEWVQFDQVRRALIVMHQRDEIDYSRERRIIIRKL